LLKFVPGDFGHGGKISQPDWYVLYGGDHPGEEFSNVPDLGRIIKIDVNGSIVLFKERFKHNVPAYIVVDNETWLDIIELVTNEFVETKGFNHRRAEANLGL
jgi:hypothetical protein